MVMSRSRPICTLEQGRSSKSESRNVLGLIDQREAFCSRGLYHLAGGSLPRPERTCSASRQGGPPGTVVAHGRFLQFAELAELVGRLSGLGRPAGTTKGVCILGIGRGVAWSARRQPFWFAVCDIRWLREPQGSENILPVIRCVHNMGRAMGVPGAVSGVCLARTRPELLSFWNMPLAGECDRVSRLRHVCLRHRARLGIGPVSCGRHPDT